MRYITLFLQLDLRSELIHCQGGRFSDEDQSNITNSHQQAYHPDGNPRTENTSNMSASEMGSAAAMQVIISLQILITPRLIRDLFIRLSRNSPVAVAQAVEVEVARPS
jgi:hypothetical protein